MIPTQEALLKLANDRIVTLERKYALAVKIISDLMAAK